jgi:hypothetical protein
LKSHGSVGRPAAVINWVRAMQRHGTRDGELGPMFWKVAAKEWCGFDRIDHSRFAILFKRLRQYWQPPHDPF